MTIHTISISFVYLRLLIDLPVHKSSGFTHMYAMTEVRDTSHLFPFTLHAKRPFVLHSR